MSIGNKKKSDPERWATLFRRILEGFASIGIHRQTEIAASLGVRAQKIQDWRAGKSSPTIFDLKRIAEITERSVGWYLEEASEGASREKIREDAFEEFQADLLRYLKDRSAERRQTKIVELGATERPSKYGGGRT